MSEKKGRAKRFFADRALNKKRKKAVKELHGNLKVPPSVHGRLSVQIGIIGWVVFAGIFAIAYIKRGGAAAIIGALGLIDVIVSCIGIYQALIGFNENKRDMKPCKRGIVVNLILLTVLTLLFFGGLRG